MMHECVSMYLSCRSETGHGAPASETLCCRIERARVITDTDEAAPIMLDADDPPPLPLPIILSVCILVGIELKDRWRDDAAGTMLEPMEAARLIPAVECAADDDDAVEEEMVAEFCDEADMARISADDDKDDAVNGAEW